MQMTAIAARVTRRLPWRLECFSGARFKQCFSQNKIVISGATTTTQTRLFSNTNGEGSNGKDRRNGAVPINKTPRGRVSARVQANKIDVSKKLNGSNSDTSKLNGDHNSSSGNDTPHQSTNGEQHGPAHYLRGGLPCEPAPPPFHLADYGEESLHTLVLLRHGESEWNSNPHRFTGWCDVNLTQKGEAEARSAGRLLYENGIELDHAFTSVLKRASFSCNMALNMAKQHWVPVTKTWRLNERCYGQLQGYSKDTAWKELGIDQELVMQMRRSYDVRPPAMKDDHPHWHGNDRRYSKLTQTQLDLSRTESLKDCADRIMPFFNKVIVPSMVAGNKCLIVSHANTIRTLIKHIDNISDEDIKGMSIPTGIPLLYRLDKNMKPVDPQIELEFRYMVEPKGYTWGTSRAHGFHGVYLGDIERLQDIQRKRDATNRDWQRIILQNVAKGLLEDSVNNNNNSSSRNAYMTSGRKMLSVRQLWFKIHKKLKLQEYNNMLLLIKMEDTLDDLMHKRNKKFLTMSKYERMIDKLHYDTEGQVVEPFIALSDQDDREKRLQMWYESIVTDLEEDCLIK